MELGLLNKSAGRGVLAFNSAAGITIRHGCLMEGWVSTFRGTGVEIVLTLLRNVVEYSMVTKMRF
jgi:hypothetical protein